MTAADYVILVLGGLSLVIGYKRGFIREFFPLLSLVAAVVVAYYSFTSLSTWLLLWWLPLPAEISVFGYQMSVDAIARFVIFFLVFLAVIVFGFVLTSFLYRFVQASVISGVDRLFGMLFGALRAFLLLLVFVLFGRLAGISDYPWWRQSTLMPVAEDALSYSIQLLPQRQGRFHFLVPPKETQQEEERLKV